jgi:hypothetical protein
MGRAGSLGEALVARRSRLLPSYPARIHCHRGAGVVAPITPWLALGSPTCGWDRKLPAPLTRMLFPTGWVCKSVITSRP